MPQGISAHGFIFKVRPSIPDPTVANAWVANTTYTVTELGDIGGVGTTRNDFDITPHNRNIDSYIFGVARREVLTFPLFYNRAITEHRMLRTLQANNSVATQMLNGFHLESPDGDVLIFSGGVKSMTFSYPVDGPQTAQVTIRPTGNYILNGIEYGS